MILRRLLLPPSFSRPCSVSHFSTFQNHPTLRHFPLQRHEKAARSVKVFVWWDFENCAVPAGVNVLKVAHMIAAAVRANGIRGPLKIMAFGDVCRLSKATLEAFSHTGIDLSHIPQGGKNSADTSIIIDLMYWVSQNPPPAHLFLISGDKDFAGVLHRLRMNNYNVLLASPGSAPTALCSAASIMWHWKTLVNGENLKGRHFNQPPDGPYGSWYGHDKVALEDPFSVEQPACVQAEESSKVGSDLKFRPIPKATTKQIQQILSEKPKGLSIMDLRSELSKSNVGIDKDFYGYKKFSCFLASMQQILRLQRGADGQIYVRRVIRRAPEPPKCSASIVSEHNNETGDQDIDAHSKLSGDDMSIFGTASGKSACHPSSEVSEGSIRPELQLTPQSEENYVKADKENPPRQLLDLSPDVQKDVEKANEKLSEVHQHPMLESVLTSEVSFARRVRRIWYGCSDGGTDSKRHAFAEQSNNSVSSYNRYPSTSKKSDTSWETHTGKLCKGVDGVPESSVTDNSTMKSEKSAAPGNPKSGKCKGFLSRIINWCRFWSSDQDNVAADNQPSEKPNQMHQKNEAFAKDFFWDDVKTFIDSTRGSVLISKSRTREEIVENLLNEGPLALKSLSKTNVMHLVDLLIADKKWVEECPPLMPHSRVVRVCEKSSGTGRSTANALRSIFSGSQYKGNSQECEGDKKFQDVPHSSVSASVSNNRSSDRSRSEILSDCQKLVECILKEHPEGYNIGGFGKLFLNTYGYPLDYKKLGYKKLTSLLEISPSAKMEATYLIPVSMEPVDSSGTGTSMVNTQGEDAPHRTGNSDSESSVRPKNGDYDSPLEELSPACCTSYRSRKWQSVLRVDSNKIFESSLSDDEISNSEANSTLRQGPDSWLGCKEGDHGKHKTEERVGMVEDYLPNDRKHSVLSRVSIKPGNGFSFVTEPVQVHGDRLLDCILANLRKSGESRVQM